MNPHSVSVRSFPHPAGPVSYTHLIRYVLFVIEKIGGAGYLIDEMTLR